MKSNDDNDHSRCDRELDSLIHARRGEEAVESYIRHSKGEFARAFIKATEGVDGHGIGPVYMNTTGTLARLIRNGEIRNAEHLHRVGVVVLQRYGLHHRCLAWHRDHPTIPAAIKRVKGEPSRIPLFAGGTEIEQIAAIPRDPADRIIRGEFFAAVLREARSIGLLHVRVAQAYQRYYYEFRTTHGAYVAIARLAVLDEGGRVVKLRSWRTTLESIDRPSPRVVRQLRAIHLKASELMGAAARRLGYKLPPA